MKYSLAGYEYEAIDLDEYTIPDDATDEEIVEYLTDPLYRLCNIYRIVDKEANNVRFRPNWPQRVVLHAIYVCGYRRIAIPKARQLGFSTLFAIIELDENYFSGNSQGSIVDQTQLDATEKLDKARFAWQQLPSALQNTAVVNNSKELGWTNNSSINAGKNVRGGTNQVLHISEWGPIAWEDPKRSAEIITGAMPTVPKTGMIFAESTFKGGKGGDWYKLIMSSLKIPFAQRTGMDFLTLFFPWYVDPTYEIYGDPERVPEEINAYLDKIEQRTGYRFSEGQRLWYAIEKETQGDHMLQEYPSVIEEMWTVKEPGLIYAESMDKLRMAGRISNTVDYYDGFPVYTAWDIGAPVNTKCVIFQVIGDRIRFLKAFSGGIGRKTPGDWAILLKKLNWNYGGHFLPHDGEILWKTLMQQSGLSGVVCCERCTNIWDKINDTIASFSRFEINSAECGGEEGLIACLDYYHSKEEKDERTVQDVPVHDWSSHYCSAVETGIQAIRQGLLVDRTAIPETPDTNEEVEIVGMPKRR